MSFSEIGSSLKLNPQGQVKLVKKSLIHVVSKSSFCSARKCQNLVLNNGTSLFYRNTKKGEDTDDSKELLINLNVIQVFISIKVAMQTAFFLSGACSQVSGV